ncbi:MAG: hypothetical protein ACR2ML_10590 [Solirubrobacteraceae bacterium]
MSRRLAVLASCAVLIALAGCRPGGDKEITVSDRAIPFTFDVPKGFRKASVRPETTKGAPPLLVYKLDQLNLVDVRKTASRELAPDDIERQVARSLARLGFPGRRGEREEHNGIDMARFEVSNVVSGVKASSRLYFFAGGGGTWELECQSSGERAAELLEACDTAVDSVEFSER